MRPLSAIGMSHDYDAVVVGARAAGAATAMLLGRAGRRVLLVDRGLYGADTLSTHALLRGAVLQLHRWQLLDAVRDSGTPAIRRTRFRYGDDVVEIAIREQDGVDALYAPRRTVLDALLVDGARDAGVDVVHGVRVTDLQRDRLGRVVGITATTEDHLTAGAGAAIVIGADGAGSTVARLTGATDTAPRSHGAGAYVYGYFPGLDPDLYDWCFRPGVMAAVAPTNGGVANVSVGMPPARFTAAARAGGIEALFRTALRDAAPDLAEALDHVAPVGRFRSFPGRPGHLRRAHGPGWALVGDAGFFKDPITAHGITDALRDAELLVRSLLRTGDGAAYEATRNLLARPLLDVTTALASFRWDLHEAAALHRELKIATDEEVSLLAAIDTPSEAVA